MNPSDSTNDFVLKGVKLDVGRSAVLLLKLLRCRPKNNPWNSGSISGFPGILQACRHNQEDEREEGTQTELPSIQ
jgi:hypothetical protein